MHGFQIILQSHVAKNVKTPVMWPAVVSKLYVSELLLFRSSAKNFLWVIGSELPILCNGAIIS